MARRSLSALFTWRSAARCDESGLSATQHHVALTVSLFMSEHGDSAFPSVATLAGISGLAESTVRQALRDLERHGWLSIELNRGRGHTNRYIAEIPDVNPPAAGGIDPAGGPVQDASRDAQRGAPAHIENATPGPPTAHETHRLPAGFSSEETTGSPTENHRGTDVNPPGAGAEDVRPRHESVSSSTRTSLAAAEDRSSLGWKLASIGVAGADLIRALNDPDRAEAWLELAHREAETNVSGFFLHGMSTGAMPAPRGRAAARPATRRRTLEQLIENLGPSDGADEARNKIDVEWDDLAGVERAELHELVDELVSARLPDPEPTAAGHREADVA